MGEIRILLLCAIIIFSASFIRLYSAQSDPGARYISTDTVQVHALYNKGDSLLTNNIVVADSLYREGLRLAEKYGYQKGIAEGYYHRAVVYESNLNIKNAVSYHQKAAQMLTELGEVALLPECYGRLGLLHIRNGLPQKGLGELIKGLSLAEKYNNVTSQIKLNIVLAMHHNDYTRQYDQAIGNLNNAERLNDTATSKGKNLSGHIYLQYSMSYRHKKKYAMALWYNSQARNAWQQQADSSNLMRSYLDRVSIYQAMKNWPGILQSVRQAERYRVNKQDQQAAANIESAYASAFMLRGRYRQALEKAETAANIMRRSGQEQNLREFSPLLFKLLYINGEVARADSVYNNYVAVMDKLYSETAARSDAELRARYEAQHKDRQIHLQQLQINNQKIQKYGMMALLLLLLIIFIITYSRFNERKKNALLLAGKNREIEHQVSMLHTANEQKEMLIREIHHRVKNNLQVISSLFNLEARQTDHPEVLKVLNESKGRLKSISLIHNQLYTDHHPDMVNMKEYIDTLAGYLMQIYSTGKQQVTLHVESAGIMLNADTAVPLGLILSELITNSLKYAFESGLPGWINIDISGQTGGQYHLVYSDSGPGLPPDMLTENNRSLGMRLIQSLSRQLSGSFHYQPGAPPSFHIKFKAKQ